MNTLRLGKKYPTDAEKQILHPSSVGSRSGEVVTILSHNNT